MAWITTVSEEEATGRVAEVYERLRNVPAFMGTVPNIYKSFSLRGDVLDAVERFSMLVSYGRSGLSRAEEEMISTVVSSLNHCHY